jgi:hypothetical protein
MYLATKGDVTSADSIYHATSAIIYIPTIEYVLYTCAAIANNLH